jgi:hypothetical protein
MTNPNVAFGYHAPKNNTVGSRNTAVGYQALVSTSTGYMNTAVGYDASWKTESEPLTDWYKAAVKAKGLTPYVREKDGS